MASVLALSLSGSVSKLSVIVAAAALLGVAILTLLFFAQAREMKRLREWGGEISDRLAQLAKEQAAAAMRAAQAARAQAHRSPQPTSARSRSVVPRAMPLVAAPAAATVAAASQVATGATAIALDPSAAGTAVARTAAAGTAVAGLPVAGESAPAIDAASAADAALGVAAAIPSAAVAAALPSAAALGAQGLERSGTQLGEPSVAVGAGSLAGPGALAAAAPENGVISVSPRPASRLPVSPRPASRPRSPHPPAPVAAEAQHEGPAEGKQAGFAAPPRASASTDASQSAPGTRAPLPPKPPAARSLTGGGAPEPTIYRRERRPARIIAVIVGALVVVALAVVLVTSVLGSGGKPASTGSASGASQRGSAAGSSHRHSITDGALRVVVLNATQTNGLAAKVAGNLKGRGYSQAAALYGIPKGTYPTTMVQYASGHAHEAAGVANALKVASSEVRPLQPAVAPLSGGAPVAVIVGEATANEGAGGARNSESSPAEGQAGGETAGGETAGGETAGGGEAPGSQAAEAGA